MKATIKKQNDMWTVDVDGEYRGTLDTSYDAVKTTYDMGCTEFHIHYSNNKMRVFGREGVENFILKVS